MPEIPNPLDLLKEGFANAEAMLKDAEKCEELFCRMERKLACVPAVGEELSRLPVFASMVRSWLCKEYTAAPMGTIIAIVSAVVYFVSPIDLIPDALPGVGHVDDVAVIAACYKMVRDDVIEYDEWRRAMGRVAG